MSALRTASWRKLPAESINNEEGETDGGLPLSCAAAGLSAEQILAEMPDLEALDLQAALQYAAHQLDYPRLVA